MTDLTIPQENALRVLDSFGDAGAHPRQVAKKLWPDSPGWEKRTRVYGANRNGALGGTMPMKAATMFWKLNRLKLTWVDDDGNWTVSYEGQRWIKDRDAIG